MSIIANYIKVVYERSFSVYIILYICTLYACIRMYTINIQVCSITV